VQEICIRAHDRFVSGHDFSRAEAGFSLREINSALPKAGA